MSSSATPIPPATAIDDAPYRASLLFGAFSLFFLSFVMSGNGNAVPQLFFQRFYPEQKTVLLSASLLASTLAATAAVVLSRRHRLSQRALITAMLATVMGALALYLTRNGPVFIAIIVLVQFAVNYLTNQLDHASIARAGALRVSMMPQECWPDSAECLEPQRSSPRCAIAKRSRSFPLVLLACWPAPGLRNC
jgi:intracellular septation protein A